MADAPFDHRQIADLFAAAQVNAFTGSLTFHVSNGIPRTVEVHWRLSFGEPVRRWVRTMLGRAPPGQA